MKNLKNELYAKAFLFSICLFIGLFVIQLFAFLFMEYLSPGEIELMDQKLSLIHLVFLSWFNFLFCIILYYVFEFLIEKRKLGDLSFSFVNRSLYQALAGIFIVFVITAIYLGIYLGTGSAIIYFQKPEKVYLIVLFAMFSAISEELVFRGYLLGIFVRNNHNSTGILISSALFALLHVFNPQIDVFTIFTIFLVGLFLSLITAWLKTIYFAVGFHIAFNSLDIFLNLNPLFNDSTQAWLKLEPVHNNELLFGGINGITGSAVLSVILIIFIFFSSLLERLLPTRANL